MKINLNFKILIVLIAMVNFVEAQSNFLENLMKTQPHNFDDILKNQQKYEVQILYTQIDRSKTNKPSFKTFGYKVDPNHYFYPASTVKLPACLLSLEKINTLKVKGLTKDSQMITKVGYDNQTEVLADSTSANGIPSVSHYIKKILMVSDNDAFNRLYEFIGQKDFNNALWQKGYKNTRIVHRLQTSMNTDQNKHTNPIDFFTNGQFVYNQPANVNEVNYFPKEPIKRGLGYIDGNNQLINEPLDFTKKNKFALTDQHNLLKALLFPNSVKKINRFNLTSDDYQFVYKYMSKLPTESDFPKYAKPDYWPTYCKFALFGSEKETIWPKNIRVFNKVGDAYGFLLDNAYIVDFEAGVEFMLTVVIYCNEDQIYNDDKYDYDNVGYPFMKNIGQLLFDFELKRPKKFKPDLSYLKFDYTN